MSFGLVQFFKSFRALSTMKTYVRISELQLFISH